MVIIDIIFNIATTKKTIIKLLLWKKIKILSLGALLFCLGLTSCSEDNTTTEHSQELETKAKGDFYIGIVKWKWHRNSAKCESKFGICDVIWFPNPTPPLEPIKMPTLPVYPTPDHNLSPSTFMLTTNNINEKNELNFEIHMEIPTNEPEKVIPLVIEDNIYFTDDKNTVYTIKAGEYKFDRNIGPYGGYSIK